MTSFANLDPHVAAAAADIPDIDISDLAVARALYSTFAEDEPTDGSYDGVDVRTVFAPGLGDDPDVPIRLMRPAGASGVLPVVVAMHGGGYVLGRAQDFDYFCLEVVKRLGIAVANVEYRLSPESLFPGPLHDVYAALSYVHASSEALQIDPDRIAIAGSSAGGGLAATAALKARDESGPPIAFQLLLSPSVDNRLASVSWQQLGDGPVLTRRMADLVWPYYLGPDYTGPDDPAVSAYAAVAHATDLSGLPPTYVAAMEVDPLRDDNIAYAVRMMHAGVSVELHSFPGAFHGSVELVPDSDNSTRILRELVAATARGLHIEVPRS
jgi:acetyl esterase